MLLSSNYSHLRAVKKHENNILIYLLIFNKYKLFQRICIFLGFL